MGTTRAAHLCKRFLQLILNAMQLEIAACAWQVTLFSCRSQRKSLSNQTLQNFHVNYLSLAHVLHGKHHTLTGSHALLHRRAHAISTCSLWRPWNIHSASTEPRVPPGLKKDDNSRQQVVHQSQLITHHVHSTSKNAIVAHNLVKKRRLTDFRTTTNVSLIVHGWTLVL